MTKKKVLSPKALELLAYIRDHDLWNGSWLPMKNGPDTITHFSLRGRRGVGIKVPKDIFLEARPYLIPAPVYDGRNLYLVTAAGKARLTRAGL